MQDNQKSIQKLQKLFDKVVDDKDEDISHLKDHSKKLLTQIKNSKGKIQINHKIEQENQEL